MAELDYKALEAMRKQIQQTPEYREALNDELAGVDLAPYERRALRAVCKHPPEAREYWNDPSGNNGGGWECTICGKDL